MAEFEPEEFRAMTNELAQRMKKASEDMARANDRVITDVMSAMETRSETDGAARDK